MVCDSMLIMFTGVIQNSPPAALTFTVIRSIIILPKTDFLDFSGTAIKSRKQGGRIKKRGEERADSDQGGDIRSHREASHVITQYSHVK